MFNYVNGEIFDFDNLIIQNVNKVPNVTIDTVNKSLLLFKSEQYYQEYQDYIYLHILRLRLKIRTILVIPNTLITRY